MDHEFLSRYLAADDPEELASRLTSAADFLTDHYQDCQQALQSLEDDGLTADNVRPLYDSLIEAWGEAHQQRQHYCSATARLRKHLLLWNDADYGQQVRETELTSGASWFDHESLRDTLSGGVLHDDLDAVCRLLSGYTNDGLAFNALTADARTADEPARIAALTMRSLQHLERQDLGLTENFPEMRSFVFHLDSIYNLNP